MDESRLGTPVKPTKKLAVYSYGMLLHFFLLPASCHFLLFSRCLHLSVGCQSVVRVVSVFFFRILI